ncbi:MAG: hypothetical protein K2J20_02590, partial [Bacilli bacterium]|nr:hypothetical protein [Bacilli bacterium]
NISYNTEPVDKMYKLLIPSLIKNSDTYGTQEFWQAFALDNKLVQFYQIKELPIYMNGQYITKESVRNMVVQIGTYEDGKIGYLITNQDDNIIYSDCNSIPSTFTNLSDKVAFQFFFSSMLGSDELSEIELSKFLTLENMKKQVQEFPSLYDRISIIDGKLLFHSSYEVTIIVQENNIITNPNRIRLVRMDNSFTLETSNQNINIPINNNINIELDTVNLDEVLINTGVLSEENPKCTLTIEELTNLVNKHLEIITNQNKTR